jgi:hypothetical protein
MEILTMEENPPGNDLKIYLEAGERFLRREDLYIAPRPDFGLYAYSPPFAVLMGVLSYMPYKLLWIVDAVLHLVMYVALYWRWFRIFHRQGLNLAAEALVRLFPLWLIFTGLLYEIAYMNIYIFMAFLATLLLEAVLYQQTRNAILWLSILLPIKPQWAFALSIPFLFRQWRFLAKVTAGALLVYFAVLVLMVLATGSYALQQYREYVQFLSSVPYTFFWSTIAQDRRFGYNNSIMQFIVFFTNYVPFSIRLTTATKFLLSLPLIGIFWRYGSSRKEVSPAFALEWAFALYLLAFLWLDVVTELTFAIVVFAYLSGTLMEPSSRKLAGILFLPYALTFIWITVTGIISFMVPLPDVLIDPSLFIPLILIAMLGLYGLLLWQMNRRLQNPMVGSPVKRSRIKQSYGGSENEYRKSSLNSVSISFQES